MKSDDNKRNQVSDEVLATQAMKLVQSENTLSDEIKNRLAESRQRAVQRFATQQVHALVPVGGVFQWFDRTHQRQWLQYRTLSVVFVMMLVTFFAVQHFGFDEDLENSDAFLLAAELPPEAFADRGFDTWVVTAHN